jgi:feruloyl esterase
MLNKKSIEHALRGAVLAALASVACGTVHASNASPCAALESGSFSHTRVVSAKVIAANSETDVPAFCEVQATISPVKGSTIGVVYRLPQPWNGKMVGLGGGGWAGNIRLDTAIHGLKAGYATAQTDGGHAIPARPEDVWRPDLWSSNPEAVVDFQHRAIHLMTVVAKEVVAKYYGRAHSKAYFQGCSTGGRQALMEVQRYPEDYDGVVSMAPVYSLTVQTSAAVRDNILGAVNPRLSVEQLARINQAVLAACDARDGVADKMLSDPRQCSWDPAELQCASGQSDASCLTQAQVGAVRRLYDGVKTSDGRFVAWPMSRGSETAWARFMGIQGFSSDSTHAGGLGKLVDHVFGDASFDLAKFDPDKHFEVLRASAFAKAYEADDANIRPFLARGGKLLMWHGWNDAGPSPWLTIDYFERVRKEVAEAGSSVRLFLSPGVEHCRGGVGADQFDALGVLDRWVETGKGPDTLLTTKAEPRLSRTLCAYPAVARYKGSGDPNQAESYECR